MDLFLHASFALLQTCSLFAVLPFARCVGCIMNFTAQRGHFTAQCGCGLRLTSLYLVSTRDIDIWSIACKAHTAKCAISVTLRLGVSLIGQYFASGLDTPPTLVQIELVAR